MKVTIKVEKEVDIKYCQVKAHVRYWEDATVDGMEDTEGTLIPCREGELWCPLINIETGQIINWSKGVTAKIHYKVCDEGSYYLQDEDYNTHLSIEDNYVPDKLIPGEYGDYIIMDIDIDGQIMQWKTPANLSEFLKTDDDY